MKKRLSLISAIVITVLILNLVIISIFISFNKYSYSYIAKEQGSKTLSLLYEKVELYFYELLNEATSFNTLFCDQIVYNNLFLQDDLSDMEIYARYMIYKVMEKYPQLGVVGYGDESGRYLGLRINPDKTVNLMLKDSRTKDKLRIYASDYISSEIVAEYDNYNLFLRPWYSPVKENQKTQWSDIYVNYDEMMNLTISIMSPVIYQDNFYGIVISDVSLNLINSYLKNDRSIGNGIIYILDKDNNIVAHSGFVKLK